MSNTLTVRLIQNDIKNRTPTHIVEEVCSLAVQIDELGPKPDLVVVPELFTTGFDREMYTKYAEYLENSATLKRLVECSEEHSIYFSGSILMKSPNPSHFFNMGFILGPNGLLGTYQKIHLWVDEHDDFLAGTKPLVVKLPFCRIGLEICYDLRFPELFRHMVANLGANVVITTAAWPTLRIDHWDLLVKARAIENTSFHIACNRIGTDPGKEYPGHSAVVDPWGNIIGKTNEEVGNHVLTTIIDLKQVDTVRKQIPVLVDRSKDLYKSW